MSNNKVLIILGSTGLVGGSLIGKYGDSLEHMYHQVIYVSRSRPKDTKNFIIGDCTDPAFLHNIITRVPPHCHIDIINLVLDKTDHKTLKNAILRVSKALVRITEARKNIRIIALSTTAVLALKPYRTGYSNAKRREYELLRTIGAVLIICPQIIESQSQNRSYGALCSKYTIGIQNVVDYLFKICKTNVTARLYLPSKEEMNFMHDQSSDSLFQDVHYLIRGAWSWLTNAAERHYTERTMTYALLSLTPSILRKHIDHHLMPQYLVNHFCSQNRCQIQALEEAI